MVQWEINDAAPVAAAVLLAQDRVIRALERRSSHRGLSDRGRGPDWMDWWDGRLVELEAELAAARAALEAAKGESDGV